jgi:hypothetical protein
MCIDGPSARPILRLPHPCRVLCDRMGFEFQSTRVQESLIRYRAAAPKGRRSDSPARKCRVRGSHVWTRGRQPEQPKTTNPGLQHPSEAPHPRDAMCVNGPSARPILRLPHPCRVLSATIRVLCERRRKREPPTHPSHTFEFIHVGETVPSISDDLRGG